MGWRGRWSALSPVGSSVHAHAHPVDGGRRRHVGKWNASKQRNRVAHIKTKFPHTHARAQYLDNGDDETLSCWYVVSPSTPPNRTGEESGRQPAGPARQPDYLFDGISNYLCWSFPRARTQILMRMHWDLAQLWFTIRLMQHSQFAQDGSFSGVLSPFIVT